MHYNQHKGSYNIEPSKLIATAEHRQALLQGARENLLHEVLQKRLDILAGVQTQQCVQRNRAGRHREDEMQCPMTRMQLRVEA